MDWRREDYGYAAGTVAAVLFVAYLVAGNFGFVPSPLNAQSSSDLSLPAVARLAAPLASSSAGSVPLPNVASPTGRTPRASTEPVARVAGRPSISITTKSGTTVTPTDPGTVTGKARAPEGAHEVSVIFKPSSGGSTTVKADVTCTDATRSSCTWSAKVPEVVGMYKVSARITDAAHQVASAGPIDLTVLNPASPLGGVVKVAEDPSAFSTFVEGLTHALHL